MRRTALRFTVAVLAGGGLSGAACGPDVPGLAVDARDDVDAPGVPDGGQGTPDAFVIPDAADAGVPFFGKVYANSYQNLYAVDPDTLAVTLIGAFGWPSGPEGDMMTDIAVDHLGNIVGISWGALYAVDKDTAECTYLTTVTGDTFNALSFVPADAIEPGSDEILVASGWNGTLYQLDVATGEAVLLGDYGGIVESSGDIVSVDGFGTVATVKNGSTNDYLARIDMTTGEATMIGTTGIPDIWGIGFWKGQVFGFVATNEFVLIDVDTGESTLIWDGPENWAGAGVTTAAPIIP
jgi:hypothetical protein